MLEQIRYNLTRNPPAAEALARQAQERFPDSPYSDERDMLLVLAVFNQGIDARARAEAYSYFKRHPNGRYTNDISRLTRTRPR